MNYTKSSPFIPPPPALPQFALEGDDEEFDDSDVAATTERPPVDLVRAGRFARAIRPQSQPSIVVDATSEVAVEDILLEAYVEVPPPPKTRRSQHLVTPPPSPVEAQQVDALLHSSFAPPPYQYPYVAPGFASYEDSPSVAPVAFPSVSMMVAGPIGPQTAASHHAMNAPTVAPPSRAGAIVGWCAGLLALSAIAGAVVTVGLKNGTFDRFRASTLVSAKTETASAPVAPAKPAPHSVPITAPPAPAPVVPAVAIDSLPKPAVGENMTLVTFPASAQGHRVFFDGKPYAVTPEPLMLRCGRHNIRIGSAGKVRVTDLTCGREQTLTR